jgi:hypothetical protein
MSQYDSRSVIEAAESKLREGPNNISAAQAIYQNALLVESDTAMPHGKRLLNFGWDMRILIGVIVCSFVTIFYLLLLEWWISSAMGRRGRGE